MAVITFSREIGTGGFHVARALAQKAGYRFIYRNEFIQGCQKRGLEIDIEKIEGRLPTIFERLFKVNRQKLKECIREIMEEAADAGNVVIGGWGGQVLFKEREDAVHIRIIASQETRIRYLMESSGLTHSMAEESIQRADRHQSLFSQYFFDADFSDPELYHLIVNLDQFDREEVEDFILDTLPPLGLQPA